MKRALALAALVSATVALAQQTTPADPRTSTILQQQQTAPPSDSIARSMSESDKQTLMRNCMRQVQADNPNVPEKDVKVYCDNAVKSYSARGN